MTILNQHLQSALTKAGQRDVKAVEDKHYRRTLKISMIQDGTAFYLKINGGSPLPATDVEIQLWQELQSAKRAAKQATA